MSSTILQHERAVLDLTLRLLEESAASLSASNLSARSPAVIVEAAEEEARSSEVVMELLDGDDIVDVIEFHIYLGGRQVASLSETEAWLRDALRDAVRRRSPR